MWVSSRRWLVTLVVWHCVAQHWKLSTADAADCNPSPSQSRLVSRVLLNLIGSGPTQLSDADRVAIEETFITTYNELVNCNNQDGAFRTAVEAEVILPPNSTDTSSAEPRRHRRRLAQAQSFSVLVQVVVTCSGECGSLFTNGTASNTRRRRIVSKLTRQLQGSFDSQPLLPFDPLKKQTSKSAKAPVLPAPKQPAVPKQTPSPVVVQFPTLQPISHASPPPFFGIETPAPSVQPSSGSILYPSFTPITPVTSSPSFAPIETTPTVQPPTLTATPTVGGTFAPVFPVTSSPTVVPVTSSPSFAPVTSTPSFAPVTSPPTFAPVTSPPTFAPVTSPPTFAPVTSPPTFAPVTSPPTFAPVTSPPTFAPATLPPTFAPVTSPPTFAPVTSPPTFTPVTSPPTFAPVTSPPTFATVTAPPTFAPSTRQPTLTPAAPTALPSLQNEQTPAPTASLIDCQCAGPNLRAFEVAFQAAILTRGLRDLSGVGKVVPLVPVDCTAPLTEFTNFIALGVDGVRNNVTQSQLDLVSRIFRDAYNGLNALNSLTCDLQFRVLTDVTATADVSPSGLYVNPTSSRRQLATSSSTKAASTLNRYVLLLTLKGTCRGCKSNTKVYNDVAGRRALKAVLSSPSLSSLGFLSDQPLRRVLQTNVTALSPDCACPAGNPTFRLPTKTEIQSAVNTQVTAYGQTGQLTSVTSVEDVTSLGMVLCAPEVTKFETTITIQLSGAAGTLNLTSDDLFTVVAGFTQTYNAIAEHFCDPYFRSIESTALVSLKQSRRLATTTTSKSFLSAVLKSKGTCRGCKSNTKIFADTSGRRRLHDLSLSINSEIPARRRLQATGRCFCDLNFIGQRAPTSAEFSEAFNNFTSRILDVGVDTVIETPGNISGTSSPTIVLTATPVAPPTLAPQPTTPPFPSGSDIVCVAVIDEASSPTARTLQIDWITFRKAYPKRPFCLLQPLPTSRDALKIPNEFLTDPNIIYSHVNRDEGKPGNTSDWFEICRLSQLRTSGFSQVALFVDNSGSLVTVDVQASYDRFLSDIPAKGYSLNAILETTLENYILPFLDLFNYTGTLAPAPLTTNPPEPSIPLTRLPVFSPSPPPVPTQVPSLSQNRADGGNGQVDLPTRAPVFVPSTTHPVVPTRPAHPVIACVAVIDEAGSPVAQALTPEWDQFRRLFPERPFCLLQPVPIQAGELFIPTKLLGDHLATFARVSRDAGVEANASNWLEKCGLSEWKSAGITLVALWVGNSGTMSTASVQASYNSFLSALKVNEFTLAANLNGTTQDYILPFIRDFSTSPTSSPVPPSTLQPTSSSNTVIGTTLVEISFVDVASSNSTTSGR